MQTTYRSGGWYVIVLPNALVALPPEVSSDAVAQLWERMPAEGTLPTVIDVLSSQSGGVVAALPPFVAAVAEGSGIRIALRGGVTAHVVTAAGQQELSGAGVITWNERFVESASRVDIAVEAVSTDAPELPVRSAVVRAAAISAELVPADTDAAAVPVTAPVTEPVAAPVTEPVPAPVPEPVAVPVPEPAAPAVPEPVVPALSEETLAPPPEATLAPPPEDVDQLWGATVHVAAPEASVPGDAVPAVAELGDHDGATISAAALAGLRPPPPADRVPADAGPVSPAATGRIRVSTGQVVTLDRTVIIGRRPRSTRASGANLPHLIAVDSPQQDISRSHLEIRPEGDTVVVIDLHTTNGSTLRRPGADPVRLHPGEQTLVLSGDVVDLGDGVEVVFEDLP